MSKKLLFFVVLCLVVALFLPGCSGISKEDHAKALEQVEVLEGELQSLKTEHSKLKEQTKDWVQYDETQKAAAVEVAKRETDIKNLDKKKADLTKEIASLQGQVDKLKQDIIKATGSTKSYPAGELYAGVDFPVGRYRIHGGSSNFVVYSASGYLRVNIILGSSYGVSEYIYRFEQGDKIEARSSYKMTPIQ